MAAAIFFDRHLVAPQILHAVIFTPKTYQALKVIVSPSINALAQDWLIEGITFGAPLL
jgi:hypothetical protein